MPLILTESSPFSKIHFKPNTIFKAGKLGQHCDFELIQDVSEIKENSDFKSIKSYIGNIFGGVFHGKGKLTYTNGDEYVGRFELGRKEGRGMYKRMATGDEYDSEWQEDLLHGKCKIKFGSEEGKGFVNLGDFVKGFNQVVGKRSQKALISSFIKSEYDYSPPVSEGVDIPDFNESAYSKFNFEAIIRKAYQNKNQNQGDKNEYQNTDLVYKSFDTEHSLLNTLPRNCIKLLNQFVKLHDIVLPSVFPSGYIYNKEFFDFENCVFSGPYIDTTEF